MPFVGALEHMAEAVAALDFGGEVAEMRGVRLLRGLRLDEGGVPVEVKARRIEDDEVQVEIWAEGETRGPAYRAVAVLAPTLPAPPDYALAPITRPSPVGVATIYNRWLFHGPLFQTVTEMLTIEDNRLTARLRPTRPKAFYPPAKQGRWLFDPGVMDAGLHLVSVWSRAIRDTTALPAHMGRVRRFGDEPLSDDLIVDIAILSDVEDPIIRGTISIIDDAGRARILSTELDGASSGELNRLGGGWAGGHPADLES
jgi:hypothetical protein